MNTATKHVANHDMHTTTTGPVKATTKVRVRHLKEKVAGIKETATSEETKSLAQQIEDWCNEMLGGDDSLDSDDDV